MARRKSRVFIALLCALFLAWYLFLPVPLGREIVTHPVWAISLDPPPEVTATDSETDEVAWFRLGDKFGYVNQDGDLLSLGTVLHNVTLSEFGFINYTKVSDNFLFFNHTGRVEAGFHVAGYPVLSSSGERLFVFKTDLSGVQEFSRTGEQLWERSFGSVITSVAASDEILVVGLLSGSVELVDRSGEVRDVLSLTDSKIPVTLGCDITRNGRYVAIVAGHGPQQVVVFERQDIPEDPGSQLYIRRFAHELPGESRREVMLRFLHTGKYLLVQGEDRVHVFDTSTGATSEVILNAGLRVMAGDERSQVASVVFGDQPESVLCVLAPLDRQMLREQLPDGEVFLRQNDERILLGSGSSLLRIDIRES